MIEERTLNLEPIALRAGALRKYVEDIIASDPEQVEKNLFIHEVAWSLRCILQNLTEMGCLIIDDATPETFWEHPEWYPIPVSQADESDVEHRVVPLASGFLGYHDAIRLKEILNRLEQEEAAGRMPEGGYDAYFAEFSAVTAKLLDLLNCFWVPVRDGSGRCIRVSMAPEGNVHVDEMVVGHE